ncbi:MAG: putative O-methyltransferase YrrM [Lentisphaeria bacterium]|jgi:predicted O-methyltransferase YrrM
MAYRSADLNTAKLLAYARRYGIREHDTLKRCRLETIKNRPDADYMTMPEEAAFLAFFIKTLGYTKGLEIGVFTGYSSLSLLLAMPDDGMLVCCEIDRECADTAQEYWRQAGVAHKGLCHVGDAVEITYDLIAQGQENTFDFAYIDANKDQYDTYYEAALKLVKPSGIIMIDNMLWGGKILDSNDQSVETLAINNLNKKLHKDLRIEICLATFGDGVSFIRKL